VTEEFEEINSSLAAKRIVSGTSQIVTAINLCLKANLRGPALALLYTGIDVLGSLERNPPESGKESFIRWTERFILRNSDLPCSALDLYAARCGLLHTFGVESELSKRGTAHTVVYAWGSASREDLQELCAKLGQDHVAVHVTELVEALRRGMAQYLAELSKDEERLGRALKAAGPWLGDIPADIVRAALGKLRGQVT
jgi:hypothetical protein